MSIYVSVGIVLIGVLLGAEVMRAIVDRRIEESSAMLWIIPSILIILGGIFPKNIILLSKKLGVSYAPTLVFTFAILILFVLCFRFTIWISGMTMKINELGMQVSLLNEENNRLKRKIEQLGEKAPKE